MRILVKESITHNTTKILDDNKQAHGISLVSLLRIQKLQSKRAVSDIIVTLLLVAITVVVGIIMFGIVKDTGIAESVTSEVSNPLGFEGGVKLIAYDARDGSDLSGITAIDNTLETPNTALKDGEQIIIEISNEGIASIFLNDVIVNEVSHTRDMTVTGNAVEASEGKFLIIERSNPDSGSPQIKTTNEINGGTSVRLIIGLDNDLSDIDINDAIRIKIDATGFDLQNFIITAGHAR